MSLYAPAYYSSFKCIAQKCRHSCCVDWEIDVDVCTLEKYINLNLTKDQAILPHIDVSGEGATIALSDDGRCPFLTDLGLCRIISEYGDEFISEICREHPRFYHTVNGRREVGLGLVCEEACRIVMESCGYDEFYEIEGGSGSGDVTDFDPLSHREKIYSILSDTAIPYRERILKIEREYSVSSDINSSEMWQAVFEGLELLNDEDKGIFSAIACKRRENDGFDKYLERALAYFVFRHVSVAKDMNSLRARLGFCLLSERILASYPLVSKDELFSLARAYSEEIEYSEENTAALIFEFECAL